MKEIPLTHGYAALVDDADYERVIAAGPWAAHIHRHTVYAKRCVRKPDGKRTKQMLHRFILGLTDPKVLVAHIDRNGRHCWRNNLRIATNSQNAANGRKYRNGVTSQYRGVCWHLKGHKWQAHIGLNGKTIHLGTYTDEIAAALAYDAAARKYFGEFASCVNFPPKKPVTGQPVPYKEVPRPAAKTFGGIQQ